MTIPTDSELAQAYSQGYQDGRREITELAKVASKATHCDRGCLTCKVELRRALAKLAQPQPATKGE